MGDEDRVKRPHVVSRAKEPKRPVAKREARTMEINTAQLAELIHGPSMPPPMQPDLEADLEIVQSTEEDSGRASSGRLAHTMRRGGAGLASGSGAMKPSDPIVPTVKPRARPPAPSMPAIKPPRSSVPTDPMPLAEVTVPLPLARAITEPLTEMVPLPVVADPPVTTTPALDSPPVAHQTKISVAVALLVLVLAAGVLAFVFLS